MTDRWARYLEISLREKKCYIHSLKSPESSVNQEDKGAKRKAMEIDEPQHPVKRIYMAENPKQYGKPRPIEEDESIPLGDDPARTVRVGKNLDPQLEKEIIQVLREYKDIFAFTADEMSGIDPEVMTHELNIKEGYKPVKQKLRHAGSERNKAPATEVKKLLEAGFIRECQYTEWLSNVVLVRKPNGSWRMYVDFTDLNKACPKDDHPLPKIDRLVVSTAGHAHLSFMDANAGYHQIPMSEKDQAHTAFITSQGVYCYNVMPFGLKNAGATYQRLMNKIFEGQLGRHVEAYVDDMIEVKRLTGCLAALGSFLSRSADKSLSFFKALKRPKFLWDEEVEKAFQQLKAHLMDTPKLVSPLPGETLFVYLAISEYAQSAILVAEIDEGQVPLYFVSHALRGAETRYTLIEKVVYALVMASRKLKPYFQAHPIKVLTSQPIKKVLESKNHSSRMTDWSNQLADFGIEFEPWKAIKAQALADFIAECAHRPTPIDTSAPWALYVDGSSSKAGSGAGLVIISPEGEMFEYAVKFAFYTLNNEAEYEAVILGLNLCQFMKIKFVQVCSDSQLIVGQMTKEFEVKEENMKAYFEKAKSLARSFDNFEIGHIPRLENQHGDALARLASSTEGITPGI
ncbi:uncharacterized protein LOC110699873 [Chenopodium quinoa]|uniref:uncharacterized protein LOC110699873 n=1 Tax=Chenopodium quinoa TaxID=63459 RepID=UPI000B791530|nr:uncharacterized protein LOC110699873 [Chenopodium quinoa]